MRPKTASHRRARNFLTIDSSIARPEPVGHRAFAALGNRAFVNYLACATAGSVLN
jgi:hypothetical protein